MNGIADQVEARPRVIAAFGIAVVVLAIATLIPFSYEKTVGYNLAYCCVARPQPVIAEALESNLDESGFDSSEVHCDGDGGVYIVKVDNLPTEAAAEYYCQALSLMVDPQSQSQVVKITASTEATLLAQVREKFNKVEEHKKAPKPIKLRMTFDEAININGHDIRDVIFSESLSDEEIAGEFREIYIGDDPDLAEFLVRVTTDDEKRERMIVVGPGAADMSSSAFDEYLTLGVGAREVFLEQADEADSADDRTAAVEIVIPSAEKSFKGPGILIRVHLRGRVSD